MSPGAASSVIGRSRKNRHVAGRPVRAFTFISSRLLVVVGRKARGGELSLAGAEGKSSATRLSRCVIPQSSRTESSSPWKFPLIEVVEVGGAYRCRHLCTNSIPSLKAGAIDERFWSYGDSFGFATRP